MSTLTRPDYFVTLTVHPIIDLTPCQTMLDQQARGMIGFHQFDVCPDCTKEFRGWEGYASSPVGSYQGLMRDREHLLYRLQRWARERWNAPVPSGDGGWLSCGWRIRRGRPEYRRK